MYLQLYLHFPFCKRKCFYCDFCSAAAPESQIAAYCHALEREIALAGEKWRDARVTTIFLGGGTPSIVPPQSMKGVLDALRASFVWTEGVEFTSEANPGTLTQEWLEVLLAHGMNRLSLGVQAAQDELLQRLGRIHSFAQAREAAALARRMGLSNLSVDLMFGLPGQSPAQYRETLDSVCALEPSHVSAYSLILEEGTRLYEDVQAGRLTVPDEDAAADLYALGLEQLEQLGFHQYEISNFARPGWECRHNAGYWQGAWYLGLGVSAHSLLPASGEERQAGAFYTRRANARSTKAYIGALMAGGEAPNEREKIPKAEAMFETMMLGLRMNCGVSAGDFERRFGLSLGQAYGPQLDSIVRDGLGRWTAEGRFTLTPRGLLVQNDVLLRLMP